APRPHRDLSTYGRWVRLLRAVDSVERSPAYTRMRMRVAHLGVSAMLLGLLTGSPARGATEAQRCAAAKVKAAGKATQCVLVVDPRAGAGAPTGLARLRRCRDQLGDPTGGAFARAEARGGCIVTGDAPAVQGQIDAAVSAVDGALAIGTPSACQAAKLMAAGKNAKCLLAMQAKGATSGGVDPHRLP